MEFYEQDFTCPFLCVEHMRENEVKANGERRPRGVVHYPFSNQHAAQGYTKYVPVSEAYPELFNTGTLVSPTNLTSKLIEVNDELLAHLAKHPELLHELHPRKFEEIIASIFKNQGFTVELTPETRDGGFDIHAVSHTQLGHHLYIIECKRFASHDKVGIEAVQRLHGVSMSKGATKGILATTSTFTKDAVDFAIPLKYSLTLSDFKVVTDWLQKISNR